MEASYGFFFLLPKILRKSHLVFSDLHGVVAMEAAPPQADSTAAIAAVFGSGDLLRDILLRLDSHAYLFRAAAVSKRWLRHASDPAFLRRFRAHHPPRFLGFYVSNSSYPRVRFLPVSQHPELAGVLPTAASTCPTTP
jgi:hypothetical protein